MENAVFVTRASKSLIRQVTSHLSEKDLRNDASVVTIGAGGDFANVNTYLVHLFRLFHLHDSERQTVLSCSDQMLLVQLCLAASNKKSIGDFDVEVSSVIETVSKLNDAPLNGGKYEVDESEDYLECLQNNHHIDHVQIYQRIKVETSQNEELNKILRNSCFIFSKSPASSLERSIIEFLCEDKCLYWCDVATPLDVSLTDNLEHNQQCFEISLSKTTLSDAFTRYTAISQGPVADSGKNSVSERYIEDVILGYIHLLVNSRSELSLARVINVPDRELDHRAFTHLRHVAAKSVSKSMYQAALSYTMRVRLGGRSYQPEPSCPLAAHTKGLGDFTDLIDRLQTVAEETEDEGLAVKKVINIVKNSVLKCTSNGIRRTSVESVANNLKTDVESLREKIKHTGVSPPKSVSSGGSACGRRALRLMRNLLDARACATDAQALAGLSDAFSSQRTPVRLPCIMAQFRSPLEHSPGVPEAQNLEERVGGFHVSCDQKKKRNPQATFDWAQQLHSWHDSDDPIASQIDPDNYVRSCTVVYTASTPKQKSPVKRFDVEFENEKFVSDAQSKKSPPVPLKDIAVDNLENKTVGKHFTNDETPKKHRKTKRPLGDLSNVQPVKKTKILRGKKTVAPLTGQKKLTSFFKI